VDQGETNDGTAGRAACAVRWASPRMVTTGGRKRRRRRSSASGEGRRPQGDCGRPDR
jgi:hypothetical protein